jgi:hypothetical protein
LVESSEKKSEALKIFGRWTDPGLPAWAKSNRINLDWGADHFGFYLQIVRSDQSKSTKKIYI